MGNSCTNSCKQCSYYLCCCFSCCCCCEGKGSCIESLNTFHFDGCITNNTEDSLFYQVLPPGQTSQIQKKREKEKRKLDAINEVLDEDDIEPQIPNQKLSSKEAIHQNDENIVQVKAGSTSTRHLESIPYTRSNRGFSKWPTITVWSTKQKENAIHLKDKPIKSSQDITLTFRQEGESLVCSNRI